MIYSGVKDKVVSTVTLFSSFGTLLCCALPALLVALGAGSVMAGLVATVPSLVIFSTHKTIVFVFAGIMLAVSAFIQWRNQYAACPVDPKQAEACKRLRKISRIILAISVLIYLTGLFFAYVAPYLMK